MSAPERVETLPAGNYLIVFNVDEILALAIKNDGSLLLGPAFTTIDEMAIKFWDEVSAHIKRAQRSWPAITTVT